MLEKPRHLKYKNDSLGIYHPATQGIVKKQFCLHCFLFTVVIENQYETTSVRAK